MQAGIQASGNYGVFNILTAALCLTIVPHASPTAISNGTGSGNCSLDGSAGGHGTGGGFSDVGGVSGVGGVGEVGAFGGVGGVAGVGGLSAWELCQYGYLMVWLTLSVLQFPHNSWTTRVWPYM